jgi:hypothetical protein
MREPAPAPAMTMPTALPFQASANCSVPGKPAPATPVRPAHAPGIRGGPHAGCRAGFPHRSRGGSASVRAHGAMAAVHRATIWVRGHGELAVLLAPAAGPRGGQLITFPGRWWRRRAALLGGRGTRVVKRARVHAGARRAVRCQSGRTRPAGKPPACSYAPQSRPSARANETEK